MGHYNVGEDVYQGTNNRQDKLMQRYRNLNINEIFMREHYWFLYRSMVLEIYALLTQNNLFLILLKIGIKNSKNVSFINR